MRDRLAEAEKLLRNADNSRTARETFWGFIDLAYCALAKRTQLPDRAEETEAQYMKQVGTWKPETVREMFPKLMALCAEAYAERDNDFLGLLSERMEVLNAGMGQFFTPFHISSLMADITLGNVKDSLATTGRGYLRVHEPALGGGAMVIAMAKACEMQGYDPATTLWFDTVELNYLTYQMGYVALSLAGISAKCIHGDTLSMDMERYDYTFAAHSFIEKHGHPDAKIEDARVIPRKRRRTGSLIRT